MKASCLVVLDAVHLRPVHPANSASSGQLSHNGADACRVVVMQIRTQRLAVTTLAPQVDGYISCCGLHVPFPVLCCPPSDICPDLNAALNSARVVRADDMPSCQLLSRHVRSPLGCKGV